MYLAGLPRPTQAEKTHRTDHRSMNEPTTTTYRPLPDTIKHREFTVTLVERQGDLAIYSKQWHSRKTPIFELIQIRRREAVTFPNGKLTPAREVYPTDNDWGLFGWTHVSLDSAKKALARLIVQNTRIAVGLNAQSEVNPSDHKKGQTDGQASDFNAMPHEETASGDPTDKPSASFRPLPTFFVFDDYFHEQIERTGDIAIFAKSKGGNDPGFEVVRIRTVSERTWPDGSVTPPGEFYPAASEWGQYGWTYNTIEAARAKMAEEQLAHQRRRSTARTAGPWT